MANTVIQLKFSTVTATPTSLNVAEPAYSYSSNTLFIGSPAGTGSIAIGGQFFIDKFQRGFDTANAAFLAANTSSSSAFVQAAFNTANASFNHANAGFQAANSAGSYANSAFAAANAANATDTTQNNSITAAFTQANSNFVSAVTRLTVTNSGASAYLIDQYSGNNPSIYVSGGETIAFHLNGISGHPFMIRVSNGGANYDTGLTHVANTGTVSTGSSAQGQVAGTLYWKVPFDIIGSTYVYQCSNHAGMVGNIVVQQPASFVASNTTLAFNQANAAFSAANAATATDTTQNNSITAAFTAANSAGVYANGAFTRANNSLNATTGGTITGDLSVTGNLTVSGNTTFVDVEILSVEDSLIKLANNNTTGDVVDIGFYGMYKPTTGPVNYTGLARTAGANTYFLFRGLTNDPTNNTLASGSVTAANAATLIANVQAFSVTINDQDIQTYADKAFAHANSGFDAANTADSKAVTAGSYANSAFAHANSGFGAANTADSKAVTAGSYANSAFAHANSAFISTNGAFTAANSAGVYANSAFAAANASNATDTTQNNSITAAFTAANSAGVYANSAFDKANTDVTGISITAADHGSASAVASFKVEANGRISSANSTTIAIAASAITSGTLGVARGGTGAGTFTTNGVLLGQGTGAFTTASSSTEGHVLTINDSGVPTFSHLQGGTF